MSEDSIILGQPKKEWTLPLADFDQRLGIVPDGWHTVAVNLLPGEIKVVAFPDKVPG